MKTKLQARISLIMTEVILKNDLRQANKVGLEESKKV